MIIFRQESPAGLVTPPTVIEIRVDCDSLSAPELLVYFRQFLLAVGYDPQVVNDVLGDE